MNSYELFDAIGEVSAEKLLHSEQSAAPRRRKALRLISAIAAAVALMTATALLVNAATDGALFGRLRVWINGDQEINDVTERPAVGDKWEIIAAQDGDTQEVLSIERSSTDASETFLGFQIQVNRVEEVDDRILLHYGDDAIDLTEQLQSNDECMIDYSITWSNGSRTRLLITVSRDADGTYTVSTEPMQ